MFIKNQRVMFTGCHFFVRAIFENGDVLLKSINKNFDTVLVERTHTKRIITDLKKRAYLERVCE